MNTTGFIRGYMAKNQEGGIFLHHVLEVIEKQLHEWDETYVVDVTKIDNYSISIHYQDQTIKLSISPSQLAELQSKSPYSLDRYIWTKLEENGLEIKKSSGNYLDYVFL